MRKTTTITIPCTLIRNEDKNNNNNISVDQILCGPSLLIIEKKIDSSINFFRLANLTKFSIFSLRKFGKFRQILGGTIPEMKLIPQLPMTVRHILMSINLDDRFGGNQVLKSIPFKRKIKNRIFWIYGSGFFIPVEKSCLQEVNERAKEE